MKTLALKTTDPRAGFTLTEFSIAGTVLLAVVAGSLSGFFILQNTWLSATRHLTASSKVSNALTRRRGNLKSIERTMGGKNWKTGVYKG